MLRNVISIVPCVRENIHGGGYPGEAANTRDQIPTGARIKNAAPRCEMFKSYFRDPIVYLLYFVEQCSNNSLVTVAWLGFFLWGDRKRA